VRAAGSLGYVAQNRPGPAITVPLVAAAPTVPAARTAEAAPQEPAGEETAGEAPTSEVMFTVATKPSPSAVPAGGSPGVVPGR
jgi:ATP-dependent RNA helicase SUPV3L1/SUV3